MAATASQPRLRSTRSAASVRPVALAIILLGGAFLAIGAIFDLATDASGNLPDDHGATFKALTSLTWQQATAVAHPVTTYVTRAEAGYATYELLFGVLLLVVAAIPLRRGERWAWWCCWALVLAFTAFATLFGAHNTADLWAAIVAALLVALALIALRSTRNAAKQRLRPKPRSADARTTRADGQTEP